MKVAYTKAEANVDKIAEVLEGHQVTLMKDIAMLDQMYELNTKYYKELTMYILAGKKRLDQVRANELEQLAQEGGPDPAPRRTPRPTTTWPTCAAALRRSSTTWSSPG